MHEVDMTRCLLLAMDEWRQGHGDSAPLVSCVHLQVGSFTCVEPDQLIQTWCIAVQGSWLEGSELEIETVPLLGRCLLCRSTYSPQPHTAYRSPCCDQPLEEILRGRELRIRSVQYTIPTSSSAPSPCAASAV